MDNSKDSSYTRVKRLELAAGSFFFRYRNLLFPAIFVASVLGVRPAKFLGSADLDLIVSGIGVVLALAGSALRLAVIGFAYIRRGGRDKKVYAESLVTTGLYALSRNPMYVGNVLIALGFALIYGAVWMYLFVIPFFILVYLLIAAAEEQYLLDKFGAEFEAYCAEVPRFLPNLRGIRSSLQGFKYDWRKVLRKDYGTLSGTLAGIIALICWKMYWVYGFNLPCLELVVVSLLLIPVAAFYLTVRHLKHSGRLESETGA